MPELPRLLDQLRRAFDGEPWSGPSLLDTLRDLSAAQAAQRPLPEAHNIWEIAAHAGVWAQVVARRIETNELLQVGDAENWPTAPARPTEADWQTQLAQLRAGHAQLLRVAGQLPEADLDRPIGATEDRPQGLGSTRYVSLHGVVQHYLYHAGQIALLRKALA